MSDQNSFQTYLIPILLLLSLGGYLIIAYGIKRSDFGVLISTFGVLFLCYYVLIKWTASKRALAGMIGAAVLFRAILILGLPNLSDDFYRFIWDGNLLVNGINPFLHTPEFYLQNGLPEFLSADLFQNLNSKAYHSVYPPVNQFIFGFSASLFGTQLLGNVLVMKVIILGFEISSIIILKKLLDHFGLSQKWLLIYALNPLIILELTGNLHFEAVMVFFLLFGYYLFIKNYFWSAALCFMLAVNAKLLPLILLPYLVFSIGWKRSFGLMGVLLAGTLALHISFLSQSFLLNFTDSLSLYFQSFEFNASVYYLVRWAGFQIYDYNIIQTAAPRLAILATVAIIMVSWFYRKPSLSNFPMMYIICLGIYFLFSTTVHPWYVSSLVAFAPLAGLFFPIMWSLVIPLTYFTYRTPDYNENLWLVALEYSIVCVAVGYDVYQRRKAEEAKNKAVFGNMLLTGK